MKRPQPKALALICAVACLAFPALTLAAETGGEETLAIRVAFGDLKPERPADAKILFRRIRSAALEACGASDFSAPGFKAATEQSACYATAVAQAVAQVRSRELARLYEQDMK